MSPPRCQLPQPYLLLWSESLLLSLSLLLLSLLLLLLLLLLSCPTLPPWSLRPASIPFFAFFFAFFIARRLIQNILFFLSLLSCFLSHCSHLSMLLFIASSCLINTINMLAAMPTKSCLSTNFTIASAIAVHSLFLFDKFFVFCVFMKSSALLSPARMFGVTSSTPLLPALSCDCIERH